MQKQPSKGFLKKGVLRNSQNSQENNVLETFFLVKLNSEICNFFKNETLAQMLFFVNFAKFIRAPFLQNTTRRMLLIIAVYQ